MSNTLAELQQECEKIGRRLTDANLPLKMYGKNCQVKLELCGDNGNYWVEVRTTLDYDEKVAIIMQMFEDGTNDSIAMAVANRIKQGVIDKACEFIRLHIGVDMPVRLTPDGEPLAEDFINKAEARVNAANKVVEQFKRFMEE